ncbi:hypothetical protein F4778DRAFT_758231, partial [Xylariomycetidae sp. FL2044]
KGGFMILILMFLGGKKGGLLYFVIGLYLMSAFYGGRKGGSVERAVREQHICMHNSPLPSVGNEGTADRFAAPCLVGGWVDSKTLPRSEKQKRSSRQP